MTPINLEVGLSASSSSGVATRLGNYTVTGGGGSIGGGSSQQQMLVKLLLGAMALVAFVIWIKKR